MHVHLASQPQALPRKHTLSSHAEHLHHLAAPAHEPLLPRQGDNVEETTPLLDRNEERSCCCCSARTQTTAMILLMMSVLCMGQNLIAPHLTDIAQDFGFTDAERDTKVGGELSFSLFLVGAPAALVIGYYADRVNRRTLFALVVLLGQGGHILVIFVTEFWQLFALRALTGISLGGSIPLVFSMVGDMYADHERPPVSAAVGMASGIGMGAGQLMSAIVGDLYGWRMPFAVVAVAACLMSLLFFMLATEPKRGAHERFALLAAGNVREDGELPDESVSVQGVGERAEADGTGESKVAGGGSDQEKTLWGAVRDEWARVKQGMRDIFSRRSNWIIFLQGIPGCVPGSMIGVFLNDYLYIDKHAPSKLAALAVCAGWGAGNMFGQVLGGWLGQRLLYAPQEKRHRQAPGAAKEPQCRTWHLRRPCLPYANYC